MSEEIGYVTVEPGSAVSIPAEWYSPLFTDEEKTLVKNALEAFIGEKTRKHLMTSVAFERPHYVEAYDKRIAEIDRLNALGADIDKKLDHILFVCAGGDVQSEAPAIDLGGFGDA
jgi:hypothetical protein